MRIKADLILIFVAMIWGFAFAAQRSAASTIGIWWFNGIRFFLAAIFLLPFLINRKIIFPRKDIGLILLTSIVLACASGLQQAGLRYTTAANAGFITSLYVVLVPIISFVLIHKILDASIWFSAVFAVIGTFLLSTGLEQLSFAKGDWLEFFGAILWAIHLLLVDRVINRKVDVINFAILQYSIVALIQMSLGLIYEPISLHSLSSAWIAIGYTGIISVGVGYTLQAYAQRFAPPGDTAILLSMESVFAAVGGFLILGEVLSPIQIVGCLIILAAVIWSQKSRIINPELA